MKLATLCYVVDKTKSSVLMLHRVKKEKDYHQGKWNGLGGKFNPGETPEECAVREIKEESGLIVRNPAMRGFITFPKFDGIDDWYVFLFTAENYSGNITESPEGKLEWIKIEKLKDLNLWEGDKIFLEWIFKENFFSAKFNYEEGRFIDYSVNFY